MTSVFLSYSSHDKSVVGNIANDLKAAGIDVWFDVWNIVAGHSITAEIQKGLARSDFVVLILSQQAVASGWVEKEWQSQVGLEAESRGVRIIPALLDDCQIPLLLRDKRCADFTRDYEAGLEALVRAIETHSTGALTPPEGTQPPDIPPAYLDWVWRTYAGVDLLGQEIKHGQNITLSHVYVPALTQPAAAARSDEGIELRRARGEEDQRPTLLLGRLEETSLFVDAPAGAGKSTFCRWAALQSLPAGPAAHPIPPPEGFEEPIPTNLRKRLPLLVPLREFATCMDCGRGRRTWRRAELERALTNWVDGAPPDGLNGALLRAHLRAGSAFLLLDGLDEVPVSELHDGTTVFPRELLLSGLADALPAWEKAGNRTLLTSRPYGLDEAWLARLGLERAPLQPLPEPLQDLFITRWFHTLKKAALARQLIDAMRDRSDLAPLVENPLLLTAVCVLYDNGGRLPEDRYELYHSIVSVVLHSRYPGDARVREPVLRRLEAIAYGMHTGESGGLKRKTPAAEISWIDTERLLAHFASVNPAYEQGQVEPAVQLEDLLHRSGLLVPKGRDRAAFYHLSFQEFLAAQRVARTGDHLDRVFRTRGAVPEWRLTLLFLFAAQIASKDAQWGLDLLARLLAGQGRATVRANPATAVLVAEALELCLAKRYRVPDDLASNFRQLALHAIQDEIEIPDRQTLGLCLGRLGDPRMFDLRDPRAYVEVPAGVYPYGEKGKKVEIATAFRLGRYPVTNGQYRAFMDDGGYRDRQWWSDAGWAWQQKEGVTEPGLWRDRRWNGPNQPVVEVSFFEAEACCAWAGGRLPSEQEWGAAARGPKGHEYPWGNDWKDGICNTGEAGLGVTSPVGLFPRSRQAQLEIEDLAGNVWEWCASIYEDDSGSTRRAKETRSRVLRGGSWSFNQDFARCANRNRNDPNNRNNDIGFRVVCSSHISPHLPRLGAFGRRAGGHGSPCGSGSLPGLSADHGLRTEAREGRWRGRVPSARPGIARPPGAYGRGAPARALLPGAPPSRQIRRARTAASRPAGGRSPRPSRLRGHTDRRSASASGGRGAGRSAGARARRRPLARR